MHTPSVVQGAMQPACRQSGGRLGWTSKAEQESGVCGRGECVLAGTDTTNTTNINGPKKRTGKPRKRVEGPLQEEVESVMEDETAEEADEGDEMAEVEHEWEPENDDMADY